MVSFSLSLTGQAHHAMVCAVLIFNDLSLFYSITPRVSRPLRLGLSQTLGSGPAPEGPLAALDLPGGAVLVSSVVPA